MVSTSESISTEESIINKKVRKACCLYGGRPFLSRALSESKSGTQLELSASHTCALSKSKSETQLELSAAGRAEHLAKASQSRSLNFLKLERRENGKMDAGCQEGRF